MHGAHIGARVSLCERPRTGDVANATRGRVQLKYDKSHFSSGITLSVFGLANEWAEERCNRSGCPPGVGV